MAERKGGACAGVLGSWNPKCKSLKCSLRVLWLAQDSPEGCGAARSSSALLHCARRTSSGAGSARVLAATARTRIPVSRSAGEVRGCPCRSLEQSVPPACPGAFQFNCHLLNDPISSNCPCTPVKTCVRGVTPSSSRSCSALKAPMCNASQFCQRVVELEEGVRWRAGSTAWATAAV